MCRFKVLHTISGTCATSWCRSGGVCMCLADNSDHAGGLECACLICKASGAKLCK